MGATTLGSRKSFTDRVLETGPERPAATLGRRLARSGAVMTVVGATLLLCWSRLANLGTGFWNDEAYTALTPGSGNRVGIGQEASVADRLRSDQGRHSCEEGWGRTVFRGPLNGGTRGGFEPA
jgi:hypothetical protein